MSATGTVSRADAFGSEFDAVLTAARAGAAWALRRLYDGLAPAVLGYLRGQGMADPEGMTNEVFSRAFRRLSSFEGDSGAFRSWVFTIAHNAHVDERRRRGRRVQEAAPLEDDAAVGVVASAEDTVLQALSEERVRALLSSLPEDQRDVLVLRLVADLTIAQIAEIHGRSVGATKALQRRGLDRLRKMLSVGVPL